MGWRDCGEGRRYVGGGGDGEWWCGCGVVVVVVSGGVWGCEWWCVGVCGVSGGVCVGG